MVFFDIGANEGEHTVFAAAQVPRGQVYAFEPFEPIRKRLVENIKINRFKNVTVLDYGLSDSKKELPLYGANEPGSDGAQNDGQSTLYAREGVSKQISSIKLEPLDEAINRLNINRVDFMKIDVEGAELAALKGAHQTIQRFRPMLLLEVADATCRAAGYTPEILLQHVANLNYRIYRIESGGKLDEIIDFAQNISRDVLCIPRECS